MQNLFLNTGLGYWSGWRGIPAMIMAIIVGVAGQSVAGHYPIQRRIMYAFTLENKTGAAVRNARFYTYAPVKKTATQMCRDIESSHEFQIYHESIGNQILQYALPLIPPYGSKVVTIAAEMGLSLLANRGDVEGIDLVNLDHTCCLLPEPYVESDHPLMVQAAARLKRPDLIDTIRQTCGWVASHIKYAGYISRDRGALYALTHKKGDCTEYMYLFAALCRANQIPARCVGGYVLEDNAVLRSARYHNWAQVRLENTWRTVDPMENRVFDTQAHYIAFRIIDRLNTKNDWDFHRFKVEGKGLRVKMSDFHIGS